MKRTLWNQEKHSFSFWSPNTRFLSSHAILWHTVKRVDNECLSSNIKSIQLTHFYLWMLQTQSTLGITTLNPASPNEKAGREKGVESPMNTSTPWHFNKLKTRYIGQIQGILDLLPTSSSTVQLSEPSFPHSLAYNTKDHDTISLLISFYTANKDGPKTA